LIHLKKITKSQISDNPFYQIDFNKLIKALEVLNAKQNEFEYKDEYLIIQNLIELISNGTLIPSSIQFKHICSILRSLSNENINYIGQEKPKLFENDAHSVNHGSNSKTYISKIEFDYIKKLAQKFHVSENLFSKFFFLESQQNINSNSQNQPNNNLFSTYSSSLTIPNIQKENIFLLKNSNEFNLNLPAFLSSSDAHLDNLLLDVFLDERYKRMLSNYNIIKNNLFNC